MVEQTERNNPAPRRRSSAISRTSDEGEDLRLCADCEKWKSVNDFYKGGRGGYQSRCKPCDVKATIERQRAKPVAYAARMARWYKKHRIRVIAERLEWAKRNPEKMVERHRKGKYGLTNERWEALFDSQGRACALCGSTEPGNKKGWQVDHCHATDRVRGIVCQPCNHALGHYERRILPMLDKVQQYLARM